MVAKGLGGRKTLQRAVCPSCQEIIGKVEDFCIRNNFWALRSIAGHKKAKYPDSPAVACVPDLMPPTFYEGSDVKHLVKRTYTPLAEFCVNSPLNGPIEPTRYEVDFDLFCRMIAKIAHCLAVHRLGYGTFEAFLPDIILGKNLNLLDTYIVGGDPMHREDRLHGVRGHVDSNGIINVTIKLFAFTRLPTYHAVVGRIDRSAIPPHGKWFG